MTPLQAKTKGGQSDTVDYLHPAVARAQINHRVSGEKSCAVPPNSKSNHLKSKHLRVDHFHPAVARAQINRLSSDDSDLLDSDLNASPATGTAILPLLDNPSQLANLVPAISQDLHPARYRAVMNGTPQQVASLRIKLTRNLHAE